MPPTISRKLRASIPLRAGAYINLGAVYNRLNMLEEAIPVLRRGIQLDHNRAEGYYNLGLVYRRLGQLDLAIQAYREATRIKPHMADAHYNLGNLYLEHGQFGLALSHYKTALELRPNWEKAQHGLEQVQTAISADEDATLQGDEAAADETTMVEENKALDPEKTVDPEVHGDHSEQSAQGHHRVGESQPQFPQHPGDGDRAGHQGPVQLPALPQRVRHRTRRLCPEGRDGHHQHAQRPAHAALRHGESPPLGDKLLKS